MGLQKNWQNFAPELGFKFGVMRVFRKGITLGGYGLLKFSYSGFAKMGCQQICKLEVMRGFQKGITLGGRTSGSVRKVFGGGGWVACWNLESLCLPTEVFRDLYVTG